MVKKEILLNVKPTSRKRNPPATAFKAGNQHRFRKGESGNPAGRPKSDARLISRALHVQLASRAPKDITEQVGLPFGSSWAQCVAAGLLHTAVRGDVGAAREIREAVGDTHAKFGLLDGEDGEGPPTLLVQFVGKGEVTSDASEQQLPLLVDSRAD